MYILGAGFSRFAEIPVLDDFLFEARKLFSSGALNKDSTQYQMFNKVFRYISSLETVDKFMNFNFFNLEEVFGLIDLADMIGDHGTSDKTLGYETRGICPSCNTRRMAETAAHLTDHVLPRVPLR